MSISASSTCTIVTASTTNPFEPAGFIPLAECAFTDDPNLASTACGTTAMLNGVRNFNSPPTTGYTFSLVSLPSAPSPRGTSCWRLTMPSGVIGTGNLNAPIRLSKDCTLPSFLKTYHRFIWNFENLVGNSKIYMFPSGNNFNNNFLSVNPASGQPTWPNPCTQFKLSFARTVWNADGSFGTNAGALITSTQVFNTGQFIEFIINLTSSGVSDTTATFQMWAKPVGQSTYTLLTWSNWSGSSGGPIPSGGNTGIVTGFQTRTSLNPNGFPSQRITVVNGGGNTNPTTPSTVAQVFDVNYGYFSGSN